MHHDRLSDVTRRTKSGRVREYVPETAEEEMENIRARIAANNKATARQETPKEE